MGYFKMMKSYKKKFNTSDLDLNDLADSWKKLSSPLNKKKERNQHVQLLKQNHHEKKPLLLRKKTE